MKTRTYITNLRHASLYKYVIYPLRKCICLFEHYINEDILAQQLIVQKIIFVFPVFSHDNHSMCYVKIDIRKYIFNLATQSYIDIIISIQESKE